MKKMGIKRGLHLTVLIEKDEDHYSARCLELNLAADCDSVEEVIDSMKDLVVDYISYAIENDKVDSMFDPAPKKYWDKLTRSVFLGAYGCKGNEVKGIPLDDFIDKINYNEVMYA